MHDPQPMVGTIAIYPNPASNLIRWDAKALLTSVERINSTGQIIKRQILLARENQLSVADLQPGCYQLRMRDLSGNACTKTLIVMH